MTIQINGEEHSLVLGLTLKALLHELSLSEEGVALAVNGQVLPKKSWASQVLSDGDRVEIVRAVGGG